MQAFMDVELEQERGQRKLDALKRDYYLNLIKGLIVVLLLVSFFTIALAIARRSLLKSNHDLEVSNIRLSRKTVELATSEQKLKIAGKKLQQFAFATGHDLKESLRNITSFTQLASITMAENVSDAQAHLKQASAGGKRMRKMLDDLLHYSNLGGDDTVKAAFPLQEVVSSVKEQLKEDILSTRGDVQLTTPASLKANRNEIEQLLFNLIHNAIRYRKAGVPPRVQIKLEQLDNEVVFQVKDNGMGVPVDEQEAIFKAFHRLHNRTQSGSGLGLPICQQVVQSYGGKIWYKDAPDGGSIFCFTIPEAQPRGQF
ncbi:MAG: ATP-binding protein [Bacteroidota bacterium]